MRSPRSINQGVRVLVAVAVVGAWMTAVSVSAAEPAPAGGASDCESSAAPGVSTQTIDVEGVARQYRLAVPEDPTGKRPPLILNFHGARSNDVSQAVYSQLEDKGPTRGFVVITPDAGVPPSWDRLEANFFEASDANLAFTRALIDIAKASLCIDTHRIYATGFSNGAAMSANLGCTLKPQLAAIAPVAGVNYPEPCPDGKPMSVIAFHGTADPSVPYGGGAVPGRPAMDVPSVESVAQTWAQRAGCRAKPASKAIGTEVQRIAYRGCARGAGVALYAVTGGGHTWPGAFDVPMLGHTTQDINAADLILDFFSQHPPPAKSARA